jgi:hypothetical protein
VAARGQRLVTVNGQVFVAVDGAASRHLHVGIAPRRGGRSDSAYGAYRTDGCRPERGWMDGGLAVRTEIHAMDDGVRWHPVAAGERSVVIIRW